MFVAPDGKDNQKPFTVFEFMKVEDQAKETSKNQKNL